VDPRKFQCSPPSPFEKACHLCKKPRPARMPGWALVLVLLASESAIPILKASRLERGEKKRKKGKRVAIAREKSGRGGEKKGRGVRGLLIRQNKLCALLPAACAKQCARRRGEGVAESLALPIVNLASRARWNSPRRGGKKKGCMLILEPSRRALAPRGPVVLAGGEKRRKARRVPAHTAPARHHSEKRKKRSLAFTRVRSLRAAEDRTRGKRGGRRHARLPVLAMAQQITAPRATEGKKRGGKRIVEITVLGISLWPLPPCSTRLLRSGRVDPRPRRCSHVKKKEKGRKKKRRKAVRRDKLNTKRAGSTRPPPYSGFGASATGSPPE